MKKPVSAVINISSNNRMPVRKRGRRNRGAAVSWHHVVGSDILVQKIILVLVDYQTAVSHRISSVLRECYYISL